MEEPCKSCDHNTEAMQAGCALKKCYLETMNTKHMLDDLQACSPEDGNFYTTEILKKIEMLEKSAASIQTCRYGHKYFADSHEYPCPRCEAEMNRKKYRNYEDEFILPTFKWAEEIGLDLKALVSEGKGNCVVRFFQFIRERLTKAEEKVKSLEKQRRRNIPLAGPGSYDE